MPAVTKKARARAAQLAAERLRDDPRATISQALAAASLAGSFYVLARYSGYLSSGQIAEHIDQAKVAFEGFSDVFAEELARQG